MLCVRFLSLCCVVLDILLTCNHKALWRYNDIASTLARTQALKIPLCSRSTVGVVSLMEVLQPYDRPIIIVLNRIRRFLQVFVLWTCKNMTGIAWRLSSVIYINLDYRRISV